jgi:hypothetical protein
MSSADIRGDGTLDPENHVDRVIDSDDEPFAPIVKSLTTADDSRALDEAWADLASAVDQLEAERSAKSPSRKFARQRLVANSRFVIPARSAAICSAIASLICLVSLVLVAKAHSADALATIALALAILSFVIQIMVFIYQSQTANQQMLQAEQLYTETRSLLTEVKTAANSTETLVREQFQDLLKAFMEAAPNSSDGGEPFDVEAFERRMVDVLRTERRENLGPSKTAEDRLGSVGTTSRARTLRDQRRREQVINLLSFPEEEEGRPALKALTDLSDDGIARMQLITQDELEVRRNPGNVLGLPWTEIDEELLVAGLVSQASVKLSNRRTLVARLTDSGRLAGRFLVATGEVPPYAINKLPVITDTKSDRTPEP